MSEELLQNIDAKLGVIVGLMEKYMGMDTRPAAIQFAERVLEEANAAFEKTIAPVPTIEEQLKAAVEANDEDFQVGDTVLYVGTRKADLKGKEGTIVQDKEGSPWFVVMFDGQPANVRKGEISKTLVEQPPALSHEEEVAVEERLEAQQEASEGSIIKIDEEAAEYKLNAGVIKGYRNIHAAYSDMKKAELNRKYLRFRAKKVILDDTTTQEMCHRYLVSVQDEEYMKEVGA